MSCEYRDLSISIWTDESPGFFRARAEEEFGQKTEPLRIYLPFHDRWFIQYADRLGTLDGRELHYVGARLFESLFRDDILRLYVRVLEQVRDTGARLRVRLLIDPPIVARLPWECLYDTHHGMYVTASNDVTLVRYVVPAGEEPPPVPLRTPMKVLIAAMGEESDAYPSLVRDARTARRSLAELESEAALTVFEAGSVFDGPAISPDSLETVLARKFDVVHLFLPAEWEGERVHFSLGEDRLDEEGFARTMGSHAPSVLVWSGGESTGAAGPSLAAVLSRRVPALVTHRRPMPEELLYHHTLAFYRALVTATPIDNALGEARSAAMAQVPVDGEWVAPAIFLARRDASVLTMPSRGGVADIHQLSEGRYRRKLRETLNRLWLKPERCFRQKLQWVPGPESLASYMSATELLAEPQSITSMCSRFQRLWITGPPGSGKTMALRQLFYEAAQTVLSYESKSPLPVYVALPNVPEGGDLFETLAEGFDRTLFASDLEEGRFLFLLDTADGLSARGAARNAQSLNHFMKRYPMNRFVVATRGRPPIPIDVANRAEMLPLTEWEALDFLVADGAVRPEPAKVLRDQLAKELGPKGSNPQLLAFARRLWHEGARVPGTTTSIFLEFFRKACARLRADSRENLLPQLAFFMSREGRLALHKEDLEEHSKERDLARLAHDIAFRGMGVDGPEELLAEIEKTRLLCGPGAFSFPNLAFQEFLTAYAIRFAAPNTILGLVSSADWRELGGDEEPPLNMNRSAFHGALPFVCGLREDGPSLVERLAERDLVLASACYGETRASTSADLALRAAVERGLASKHELEQRVAVVSLEARADAWALDWLENIAGARDMAGRALAIAALGNLAARRSAPVLEEASSDTDPVVARTAAEALNRIRTGTG